MDGADQKGTILLLAKLVYRMKVLNSPLVSLTGVWHAMVASI
jgi:hypothetical protein